MTTVCFFFDGKQPRFSLFHASRDNTTYLSCVPRPDSSACFPAEKHTHFFYFYHDVILFSVICKIFCENDPFLLGCVVRRILKNGCEVED